MVIRRPSGCTAHFAPRPLVAVLCVVAVLAAGCSSGDDLGAGDAATVADGSTAEFSTDGQQWTQRDAGEVIPADAQVRSVDDELGLQFRDGEVRLSPDAVATISATRVTLERGQALVDSDGALTAAYDDATVAGAGQYRLAAGLASRVGVYSGDVVVRRPAQEQQVAALRQLDLSAFRLEPPTPLQYRDSDVWDQQLLADAIAFDGEASRLAAGMDSQLGTRVRGLPFYRQFGARSAVLPVLTRLATVARNRRFGPPSDVLLPLFVAQAASGTIDDAAAAVGELRNAGAKWGLIALELDVRSQQVVAAIDLLGDRQLAADRAPRRRSGGSGDDADVRTASADTGSTGTGAGSGSGAGGSGDGGGDGSPAGSGSTSSGSGGSGSDDPQQPSGGGGTGGDDPGDDEPDSAVGAVVDEVVTTVGGAGNEATKNLPPPPDAVDNVVDDVIGPDS